VLKVALNKKGFFNGTFTDNGEWIFSDCDPDGECRPYGPVNWYAVIAGIVKGEDAHKLLKVADQLLGPCGYRLFTPPMGTPPIANVGRIGSGDHMPYFAENGNVYNHGSQGFLARAMAVAGDGDGLLTCLKYMLPYDQDLHPTATALSAPYAIANCWHEIPGFTGRVMMTFLTGTVAMAIRGVYEWMMGIQPTLDGLMLDPCLPNSFENVKVHFEYRGKPFEMRIENNTGVSLLSFNGKDIVTNITSPFTGRAAYLIKPEDLKEQNYIVLKR